MYLVEYDKGRFVDAHRLDRLAIFENKVVFYIAEVGSCVVDKQFEKQFMHALQLCNSGRQDVEKYYNEVRR